MFSTGEHPGLAVDVEILKLRPEQAQHGPPGHSRGLQVRPMQGVSGRPVNETQARMLCTHLVPSLETCVF